MLAAAVAVCVVQIVSVAVYLAVVLRPWRGVVCRPVIVALTDGPTLRGVLLSRRGPLLRLVDVEVSVGGSTGFTPMDGLTVVERSRVAWVQVVG